MSRLSRALRELGRTDAEASDRAYTADMYGLRMIGELHEPLDKIATALTKMERRRRRPRIVMCEHPDLHPELELPV